MEIRELRSFVLLAEQLHFGRAAKLMNLSQPALTKQVRRMEEELGTALFDRGKKGTALSTFGEWFLKDARLTLQSFDGLMDRGKRAAKGEAGRLNIGFGFHTFELVPRLIVKLREIAPGIEVSLRDMSTDEQRRALEAGRIDLGFLRLPLPSGYKTLPVVRDKLALISSGASGLPATATLKDCRDVPFVALSEERAPGFHHHMLMVCGKYGFYPKIVQQVPELTTAVALVRAGLGVAVIPESFWSSRLEDVRLHAIKDREAGWQVSAGWHAGDTNPALAKFLGLLREEVKAVGLRN
ncbi:MAG TPA: LysR family transcriptional regulator [Luteolibacter sp.]|nr:LysR family transcriptional regulator [Luteolibacter sp.]